MPQVTTPIVTINDSVAIPETSNTLIISVREDTGKGGRATYSDSFPLPLVQINVICSAGVADEKGSKHAFVYSSPQIKYEVHASFDEIEKQLTQILSTKPNTLEKDPSKHTFMGFITNQLLCFAAIGDHTIIQLNAVQALQRAERKILFCDGTSMPISIEEDWQTLCELHQRYTEMTQIIVNETRKLQDKRQKEHQKKTNELIGDIKESAEASFGIGCVMNLIRLFIIIPLLLLILYKVW